MKYTYFTHAFLAILYDSVAEDIHVLQTQEPSCKGNRTGQPKTIMP
jgi:hypothetical protein